MGKKDGREGVGGGGAGERVRSEREENIKREETGG